MAEMRRPNRAPGVSNGASSARKAAPQRKPTPWFIWVGLALAPIAIIFLTMNLFKEAPKPEVETKPAKKVDPNLDIKKLEAEVNDIQASYRSLLQLIRAEDATAKKKVEALKDRIGAWMERWDGIFEPKRDPEGKLPPEMQGYQKTRQRVNEIRLDLLKTSGL